jgi:hypothetical protein
LPLDKETRDLLGACVQKIRGFGARKLTEQEFGRWRQLINSDSNLQFHIIQAQNLDQLKQITELSEYRMFFTRSKWMEIMICVYECLQRQVKTFVAIIKITKNTQTIDGRRSHFPFITSF